MTEHGSFPGRPRGRRARPDSDVPDWQGYDTTPADQREFPDLSPIRPRDARARDGRVQGDQQAQSRRGEPGQGQQGHGNWQPGGYPAAGAAGYPGAAASYPPTGPSGQAGAGQGGAQPWQQEANPGYPQVQQAHERGAGQPPRGKQPEEDIPAWAEPDSVEAFSARWHRRGLDSRDDRRSDRRKRRRAMFAGGGVAAVAIAVAGYFMIGNGGSATPGFGALVTSFLPGELQSVPDACTTVPAGMLSQYLPGTPKEAAPPLNSGANTQCTWTLDSPPMYRELEVELTAYSPSALYGNGSATAAAELAFESSDREFAHPGPKSGQPTAVVTDLSGMPGGNDTSAFIATQVFNRSGAVTDMATVLVRYRNVTVTVVVNGLDQASGKKKYGPVAMSDLTVVAQKVAKEVAGEIVH